MFERKCRECGCTDRNACVDPQTGEACAWAEEDLCTFCDSGRVEIYTEAELRQALKQLKERHGA